jgi:hypothetical protein
MCCEVVGHPVRYVNETKFYTNFHFSRMKFNLRYEIFDRNVAYSYKTLTTKYGKSSVSLVFSFAIGTECAVLLFGCKSFYLFIAFELRCYKYVSFNRITLLTKFMFDKNKTYFCMWLKHTCKKGKVTPKQTYVVLRGPGG